MGEMSFNDKVYLTQYIRNRAFQQMAKKPSEISYFLIFALNPQNPMCILYLRSHSVWTGHVSRAHQVVAALLDSTGTQVSNSRFTCDLDTL